MARPRRTLDLVPVTVKLDMPTHARATHVAAVSGTSLSATLRDAVALGLDELRYAQVTTGRSTSGALLAIAPGVVQLRITTSDERLASLLVETLNACEEQAHQKGNTDMQPYSDKSNEPDSLKTRVAMLRLAAAREGYEPGTELNVIDNEIGCVTITFPGLATEVAQERYKRWEAGLERTVARLPDVTGLNAGGERAAS